MKNVIVIYNRPQECGSPSLKFVDCSTGEVLKDIDLYYWKDGYWETVFRDKTLGTSVTLYLEGAREAERLKDIALEKPRLCVLKRDSYMLELISSFHEYTLDWSGTNIGSLSETEDVNPKTWIRPEETTFYYMTSCKYLRSTHHSAILRSRTSDKTADYSYVTHLYEVTLVPVTFSEEPTYHREADDFYQDLAEQGIDPSGISDEDRSIRSSGWLAHYIAKQFGYKILNIINL